MEEKETKSQFSCVACHVQFTEFESQRAHHRSEWHRYNLKRKITGISPISLSEFQDRLSQSSTNGGGGNGTGGGGGDKNGDESTLKCGVCDKIFNSENTLQNHFQSKKHQLKERKLKEDEESKEESFEIVDINDGEDGDDGDWEDEEGSEMLFKLKQDSINAKLFQKRLKLAQSEDEIMKILEEKVRGSIRLDPLRNCLFCPYTTPNPTSAPTLNKDESLEHILEHMAKSHSFFLPDLEYLTDPIGLLLYLGEKISVKNQCIYCNGRGKSFFSLESVWAHISSMGHSKISFETESDELEISDFYDFSSTWSNPLKSNVDAKEGDVGDDFMDVELVKGGVIGGMIDEDSSELILPSGAKVGNRALNRYYKQHLRVRSESESIMLAKIADKYRDLIHSSPSVDWRESIVKGSQRSRKDRDDKNLLKVGYKSNSQKHFRAQIDF